MCGRTRGSPWSSRDDTPSFLVTYLLDVYQEYLSVRHSTGYRVFEEEQHIVSSFSELIVCLGNQACEQMEFRFEPQHAVSKRGTE